MVAQVLRLKGVEERTVGKKVTGGDVKTLKFTEAGAQRENRGEPWRVASPTARSFLLHCLSMRKELPTIHTSKEQ